MSIPAGSVYMADNVEASYLPAGYPYYGGYADGPYANVSAIQKRFPGSVVIAIAVRAGFYAARAVDAEPGTLSGSQLGNYAAVVAFLSNYKGSTKPIVYTMASWATGLENYLAAHGHARGTYILWVAHYTGLHICGPHSCGYSSGADGTQYATGRNDFSVFGPGILSGKVTPTAHRIATTGVSLGDTDANTGGQVHGIQNLLNAWAKYCGFAKLNPDGNFGGLTDTAVRLFQQKRGQGLKVDGNVGSSTLKYLQNPPGIIKKIITKVKPPAKPVPTLPTGLLKLGDQGKNVMLVQTALRNSGVVGARGIEADADFGPETAAAVRAIELYGKLKIDTGVYGPGVRAVLLKLAK